MTEPLFYTAMATRLARVLKEKLTNDELRDLVDILQDKTTDKLLFEALTAVGRASAPQ